MKTIDEPPGLFQDSIELTCKDSGVYAIINRINGRLYVGSSNNLSGRRSLHKYHIRKGKHCIRELVRDILENPTAFEFVVVENVTGKSLLLEREQFWMDFYQSYVPQNGYNVCRYSGSALGFKHTAEFRENVGQRFRGKKRPERSKEWCNKISASHAGKPKPWCHKEIIQYDLNGAELCRFPSITAAAVAVSGNSGLIVRVLKSGRSDYTAYGYKWKYA